MTEAELRRLVSEISKVPEEKITAESRFRGDLKMDSLSSLDLLTTLEDEHDVVIPQEKARDLQTFGQLCAFVSASADR